MVCSLSMAVLLSAVVVLSAPDIAMGGRLNVFRVFEEERLSIEPVLEDGFHTLVRAGPDGQSPY